jgi:small neutral amino acid transporter SnatA (MarC family)
MMWSSRAHALSTSLYVSIVLVRHHARDAALRVEVVRFFSKTGISVVSRIMGLIWPRRRSSSSTGGVRR